MEGGPKPEAARTMMRCLLSAELERVLVASDSHNSPIHAEVAEEYPQYAIAKPLDVDYARVADYLTRAIETAREILR
jgi:hypothetical protein